MDEFRCSVRWLGNQYELSFPTDSTVLHIKQALEGKTGVLCHRQRLLGLTSSQKSGQPVRDATRLSDMKANPGNTIMMIGSNEPSMKVPTGVKSDGVIQVESRPEKEESDPQFLDVNHRKIAARAKKYRFEQLEMPRRGKKLLVLDIDYTLFDHRSCAENALELARPHLHEFLLEVYPFYDIFIWSATSMKTIMLKVALLGMLSNEKYKVCALVDHRAMITVHSPKHGVFSAKPLQVIWSRYPEFYNCRNTIMVDDMERNFAMCPQNGLKITAFRRTLVNRDSDSELASLKRYVLVIAKLDDFTQLNHKHWRRYLDRTEG